MSKPDPSLSPPELIGVPHVPAALRSRSWVVAAGLLLGLAGGAFLANSMPTEYTAMGTVRLGAGFQAAGVVNNDSTAASTEAQIATLHPQVVRIAQNLGADPDVVADHLNVASRTGTSLVDFSYSAPTAKAAERGARAAAEVYLDQNLQTSRQKLNARISLLRQEASVAPPKTRAAIASDLRALQLTVVDHGTIVRDPAGSADRSVLLPAAYLGLGAIGGLLLGGTLAVLLEAARPRVRRGVPVPGLALLGRVTGDLEPSDVARMLLPVTLVGSTPLPLVPLGRGTDAVTELLDHAVDGVAMINPHSPEGLGLATDAGRVVLLVREGTRLTALRSLTGTLTLAGVAVSGMLSVTPEAIGLAIRVLLSEEAEAAEPDGRTAPSPAAPEDTDFTFERFLSETGSGL